MKKMLFLLLVIVLASFCGTSAFNSENSLVRVENANEKVYYTKPDYIFAFTEESLDKARKIVAQGDKIAFNKMIKNNEIFITGKNVEVYIVKYGLTKIKIRPKGHTAEFWTVSEAVSEKPVR